MVFPPSERSDRSAGAQSDDLLEGETNGNQNTTKDGSQQSADHGDHEVVEEAEKPEATTPPKPVAEARATRAVLVFWTAVRAPFFRCFKMFLGSKIR